MPGTVVLNGGDEFSEHSQLLNEAFLRATGKPSPRLVILPAAAENPGKVARTGIHCFAALGAAAEWTIIADSQTASDPYSVPLVNLETAQAIFLPDGSPLDAIERLRGSEALAKIQRAWTSGAVLGAAGAGAMALCDLYWDSGAWEQGLGLLPGIVVLPHYEFLIGRFSPDRLRKDLPPQYTILALDNATGVVAENDGAQFKVVGPGLVTVMRGTDVTEFSDGQTFTLD